MNIKTPYYLIDETRLLKNLKKVKLLKELSGIKIVLALKCFSTWCTFGLLKKYMDGTTSSSLYEARLGRDKFSGEVHAYSVAFSKPEINEINKYADKIIFNSFSQLKSFRLDCSSLDIGLRINPGFSYSHFDLADPACKHTRLGVTDKNILSEAVPFVNGVMFHFNCENDDFINFSMNIDKISRKYKSLLEKINWVSLGGGVYFTKKGYPLEKLSRLLRDFARRFKLQVYLEPGESVITESTELVTKVVDIVHNKVDIAIVDSSIEAHMLDLLIYRQNAKIKSTAGKGFKYIVAGRSCLAGDIYGTYTFKTKLKVGSTIRISDAGGYTMVKKNWFNGLTMPSIAVKKLNGKIKVIKEFDYNDYLSSLS